MTEGYNIAEFSLEEAIRSYLEENLEIKLPVMAGTSYNKLVYPCAWVQIEEAFEPEALHGTATEEITLTVGITSNNTQSREKHVDMVAQVMDLIFNDDFITNLNTRRVDGLVVQHVRRTTRRTALNSEEGTLTTGQRLTVLCSMNATS